MFILIATLALISDDDDDDDDNNNNNNNNNNNAPRHLWGSQIYFHTF
jgi:hypothetical protein